MALAVRPLFQDDAQRSRRRRLVVAIAVVVLVPAVVGIIWLTRGGAGQGPLALHLNGSSRSGGAVLRRQWAATTVSSARLAGSTPAVLESVTATDPGQARGAVVRFAVLGKTTHGSPGFVRGWPPDGDQVLRVRGYVVKPGTSVNIVVGVASRRLGHWRINSFSVHYRVGAQQYTATFAQGIDVRVISTCGYCAKSHQPTNQL